jgi:hypothetical protein
MHEPLPGTACRDPRALKETQYVPGYAPPSVSTFCPVM